MGILDNLYYTDDHEWAKVDGDKVYIGISDKAQELLGDIVFVELPFEGDEVAAGDSVGVIESVKAVADIYVPVSGEIVEVNEELQDAPEGINNAPYDSWILAVELEDKGELDDLMSADEYEEFCAKEEE
ncbi:MAG: glycine cleavage system protein GcvH [Bacillota bacterium]